MQKKTLALFLFSILPLSCSKELQDGLSTGAVEQNLVENLPTFSADLIQLKNGLTLERYGDDYVLEEDMIFPESSLPLLENIGKVPLQSAATNAPAKYWPGRIVPYEFDSSFTSEFQSTALSAMSNITQRTGVSFIPAQSYHKNKIKFYKSSGNNSKVGMQGGTQKINIYNDSKGMMMHEILHALGFFHEHTRADRDDYVIIKWDNIHHGKYHDFNKYNAGFDIAPFDFNSIMIYGSMTTDSKFAIDTSKPIITKLDGSTYGWNREYLSGGDIIGIASIYGPPYHTIKVEEEILQEFDEGGTDIYEANKTFKIVFYSDTSFTTPTTLTYPRNVLVKKISQTLNENRTIVEGTVNKVISVPAGTSEVVIDTHRDYAKYVNADPNAVDLVNYQIVNYH